jgi:hypothetical protein
VLPQGIVLGLHVPWATSSASKVPVPEERHFLKQWGLSSGHAVYPSHVKVSDLGNLGFEQVFDFIGREVSHLLDFSPSQRIWANYPEWFDALGVFKELVYYLAQGLISELLDSFGVLAEPSPPQQVLKLRLFGGVSHGTYIFLNVWL